MRLQKTLSLLVLLASLSGLSAQTLTLSGYIKDAVTGEALPYASVTDGRTAVYADELGFYSFRLTVSSPEDSLTFSYVGYQPFSLHPDSNGAAELIWLQPTSDLPTVVVQSSRLQAAGGSAVVADLQYLKSLPALGGEVDYLKGLSLLPGVSAGVEGTANLIIRGGEAEQTHLLVDGSPLYNANHLGGFLSAIPPAAVRDVTLYKSGVPARFGGRLSGVIDVQLRQAKTDRMTAEVLVGTATAAASLGIPVSTKSSLLLAGRYAYPSLIWALTSQQNYEEGISGDFTNFYIHDLVGKYDWQISKRLTSSLTYFQSGDLAAVQEATGINVHEEDIRWRNSMLSLRSHLDLGNAWALKFNLYSSRFNYRQDVQDKLVYRRDSILRFGADRTLSLITDVGMRSSLSRPFSNRFRIELGTDLVHHHLSAQSLGAQAFSDSLLTGFFSRDRAWEEAFFVSTEATVVPDLLELTGGMRLSRLRGTGLQNWRIEPRLRLALHLHPAFSLNVSFERHYQNLHQLRASGDLLPNQIWVVANRNAPSSEAWQWSLGLSHHGAAREWYLEGFYKQLNNLVMLEFEAGNIYSFTQAWTDVVYTGGKGKARGIEAYWAEHRGRFTGALSYTLSFADRQFDQVNDGAWFPFRFDRRHDSSLSLGYRSATNWEFTALYIFQTGHAATVPVAVGAGLLLYDKINSFRMPAFQRLDLAVTRYWSQRKQRETFLKLSVYNALNRANPHELHVRPVSREVNDPITGETYMESAWSLYQASLFPILPSVTFGVNFK